MKRFLLAGIFTVLLFSLLYGCANQENYKIMYIDNCIITKFHQEPINTSVVLNNLVHGDCVSFIKEDINGYSEVEYNGVTGYVLSSMLSDEKPEETTEDVPLITNNATFYKPNNN